MRILVLEPYFGGSHKAFLTQLQQHPDLDFDLLTMPPRKWKWRMRLAAPEFAGILTASRHYLPEQYSAILCSTFVDVATLKGLLPISWKRLPVYTYFHENQFTYPLQIDHERDIHFGLTNLTTALASDHLAFNSQYNRDSFLEHSTLLLKKADDMKPGNLIAKILAKSRIIPPPQHFAAIDGCPRQFGKSAPTIVWNHRWEHDKNPEFFFDTLFQLDREEIDFHLIVLGQSFLQQPPIFATARKKLAHKIIHFGFAGDRQHYLHLLRQGDVVVSTAHHEFFGISVVEAVRAGCRPLLPARLSYPELFPAEFIYEDGEFFGRLREFLKLGPLTDSAARQLTDQFSWNTLHETYYKWFTGNQPSVT